MGRVLSAFVLSRAVRTFTQEDPIGLAGGLNLYGFAGGDPVNFSDPFGLCPPEDDEPCGWVQRLANWAAANDHPILLNAVAGTDALMYGVGTMLAGPGCAEEGVVCGSGPPVGPRMFTRFGTGAESAERLGAQAAAAERQIGVHGVSVRAGTGFRNPGATASGAALEEAGFSAVQTGADPKHFTVKLPKPVTQAVADTWNKVWGWISR